MSFLQRRPGSATEHFVVTHFDAYQDGTLARTERAVYEQHLKGCPECQEWLRRQENLVTRLETELPSQVALGPAAAARIEQDLYHAMRRAVIMNNMKALVAGVGALALLIIAVGAIIWWQSGGLTTDAQVAAPVQEQVVEESMPAEDAAPLTADLTRELDGLFSAYQENSIFNGSVLVALGDEIIISKGYGPADAENETPNTAQTRFRIGEMSQSFTAVAILQLQEQGKLSTDDPICQYLDSCPAAWEAVTIHHLLSHSSGIPEYLTEGGPWSAESTPEQLVSRVIDLPLLFEPGLNRDFSNSGYVILGMIIERVTGQPYLAYLQENIFDPLGMADTGVDAEAGELAVGYSYGSREADELEIGRYFATASLYSTVEDLYRFSQALQKGQLLSQASRDQMWAPYFYPFSQYPDLGSSYGNWAGGIVDGLNGLHSPGGSDGYQSDLFLYPDDDLTVIILENRGNVDTTPVATEIAKRVLGDE
jgi:CubicO group peptidase (beta-lactamase class C family)